MAFSEAKWVVLGVDVGKGGRTYELGRSICVSHGFAVSYDKTICVHDEG